MLDRVRNFLPLMSAANEELDKKIKRDGKDAVNIENLTSDNSPHVAMVTKQSLKAHIIIQNHVIYVIVIGFICSWSCCG